MPTSPSTSCAESTLHRLLIADNQCPLLGVKRTSAVHFAGLGHQSGSACYFFFIMIVIRHKTTAAARWALLLIASVPLPMTPSPLQSGQVLVFTCASLWTHSQA